MKLKHKKTLAISATAVCLAATITVSASLPGFRNAVKALFNEGHKTQNYVLDPSKIVYDPNAKRTDYANNVEYLLARDGFIYGCDLAWQGEVEYSDHSLGDNHVNQDGNQKATYEHFRAAVDVGNISAIGFNAVNYWILTSLQGISFDDEGYATGLDDNFKENLEDLLQVCRDKGIMLVPSLQPHGNANSWNSINRKNETPIDVWNKYFKFLWQDKARKAYLENAIKPVCEIFAKYEDVVLCVDLTVENSHSWINDPEYGYTVSEYGTSWANYASFLNDIHDCVKAEMPNMLTSTEEMGGLEKTWRLNDLKVDLIGANSYHSTGGVPERSAMMVSRTGYVGEYNVGTVEADRDYTQPIWGIRRRAFIESSKKAGWIGCFFFGYYSSSHGNDAGRAFESGYSSFEYDRMYSWMYQFRYDIIDGIKKYRGTKAAIDAPSLLVNKGSSDVYWIPSRGSEGDEVTYKLERSVDGGKTWQKVAEGISADNKAYCCDNGLLHYNDPAVKEGVKFCHRVTATDEKGNTAVSSPSNTEEFYVAAELFENGGWETGDYTGWVASGKEKGIITDEDAASGKYSLKVDRNDKETSRHYANIQRNIKLKKNTSYTLSVKYKNMSTTVQGAGGEPMFFRLRRANEGLEIGKLYIPNASTDGEWVTQKYIFTSGSDDLLMIQFQHGLWEQGGVTYIDDISLKEMR